MYITNVCSILKMPSCSPLICKDERSVVTLVGFSILVYFIVMDIFLYATLQETPSLAVPSVPEDGHYSPFLPLSAKLIMTDHFSHYFFNPTIECFQYITRFNTVFYFITPNMISFAHLLLALIAAKFISSENLNERRVGAVLFMLRSWMDSLDGSVHRNRAGQGRVYNSERLSSGYYIDVFCDTVGGAFLSFGILFYFYKVLDSKTKELPYTKLTENGNGGGNGNGATGINTIVQYTKTQLFWKMWCIGFMIGTGGWCWDYSIDQYKYIFHTKINDGSLEVTYLFTF
ncbi:hypothetical protein SNE40_015992 [Patella caerulea]|uniref:Uncharacterized protein n=1 Tax=Patella caerulea TaxID=87958 RepID=A0AAN8PLU6_PATCE